MRTERHPESSLRVVLAEPGSSLSRQGDQPVLSFCQLRTSPIASGYPRVPATERITLRNGYGWNVKPQAIMRLLDAGFDEVIWIDSDMFVTRDIRPLLDALDEAVFVATEHTCSPDHYDHDGAGRQAQL